MLSFVESKLFTRLVGEYLTDDEYARLQVALIEAPERGALVPGSGESIPAHVLRKIKEEIDG